VQQVLFNWKTVDAEGGTTMGVDTAATPAREEVLRRIRAAIGEAGATVPAIDAEWKAIPRGYVSAASSSREQIVEMLEDRLRDYDATVVRVKAGEVAAQIAKSLAQRGKQRLVVPTGLAEALGEDLPAGFEFVLDTGLSAMDLDIMDGVVTASTLAIAETGTIVLQKVAGQGRRAPTLVPDYHLCVVRTADIVETVPEAMKLLQPTASLATTLISGPSATADIEMTRIKGVHGPRFLDVLLVG
jgi:L-lactate dehydrogenase complex protein LldG